MKETNILQAGVECVINYIRDNYPDYQVGENLIQNDQIIISSRNHRKNIVLPMSKYNDVIKQLTWSNNDLKKHLDKEIKEIQKDRLTLFQEIKRQIDLALI